MLALEKLIFPQPSRAAPRAPAPKGPVAKGISPKVADVGTVGEVGHINEAFEGDGDAPESSEESVSAPTSFDSGFNGGGTVENS